MTPDLFVHYVVCPDCHRQYRIALTNVGVRCCRFAWFSNGAVVTREEFQKTGDIFEW